MFRSRTWLHLGLALCLGLFLSCRRKPTETFRILAGSEIKDLEPLRKGMERATGMPITFTYTGSLDAVERLEDGEAFDAVWLSHGKYLQLTPSLKPKLRASERIMASPVILGVKASRAQALGWDRKAPSWAAIIRAASEGRFTFGMTNPASSNTGFTALVGVASALADASDGLKVSDIRTTELRALFKGQRLASGSSGWLAEAYVRDQARFDGMINYESVILQLNAEGKLGERLVPVYPSEGVVTADYPLMLLQEAKRPAFEGLVNHLKTPEVQREISKTTLRRPMVAGVEAAPVLPRQTLAELPFPASRDVLDALIDAYQSQLRRPASTYFVLDTSGSMQGEGIHQLQNALLALAGEDRSLSGRFSRFQTREQITLLPFNHEPGSPVRLAMPEDPRGAQQILAQAGQVAHGLQAAGGTAIFGSVKVALELAQVDRQRNPDRQYSVVVMTDGRNESGLSQGGFEGWYGQLREEQRGIPVFALLFGKAEPSQLERIAELTGGRVFDGRKGLKAAFKEIRGYQ